VDSPKFGGGELRSLRSGYGCHLRVSPVHELIHPSRPHSTASGQNGGQSGSSSASSHQGERQPQFTDQVPCDS
jgi:hypothetical protein